MLKNISYSLHNFAGMVQLEIMAKDHTLAKAADDLRNRVPLPKPGLETGRLGSNLFSPGPKPRNPPEATTHHYDDWPPPTRRPDPDLLQKRVNSCIGTLRVATQQ